MKNFLINININLEHGSVLFIQNLEIPYISINSNSNFQEELLPFTENVTTICKIINLTHNFVNYRNHKICLSKLHKKLTK